MANPTVREIVDAYLYDAEFIREIASPASLRCHFKHFLKHFGDLTIDEMCVGTKKRAKEYEVHRCKVDGVEKSTVNREGRNWRAAQNFAFKEDMISAAQVKHWPIPKANEPRDRVLSHEAGGELDRVVAELDKRPTPPHLALFVRLALFTGQRKTAILELKREHIDLDRGVIWFSRTQAKKTKKKRQDQPIHDDLRPFLEAAIAKCEATGCDYLVQYRAKPVRDVRTAYQALLKRARVEGRVVVHDLRRTVAQTVRDETDDLEQAASLIGDTAATTGAVYARKNVKANLKPMNVMAQKMARAGGGGAAPAA